MKPHLHAFYDWVIGKHRLDHEAREITLTSHLHDHIAEALHAARKNAASDGRSPTLLDYFLAAEKLGITPQQMTDLSGQDLSGFIVARPHLEDARLPYIRSHGITVRGSKLDRCKLVPMTVVELMAFDSNTTMREVEFVAA
jgi:hypothetical protein